MMNTFCDHFFSTTHNKFEPNNIGWSGTTPGRAGSCFYLVGWSDYLLSWWKRSFFPSLRHSRLCGFWLGLVPPPPSAQCIRWGLILRLFELGGIQSCSKTSPRFRMTCILSAKTMSWGELYRISVSFTAMDCRNDWRRSCAYVLCCQFANKAVCCKIWGSHRGGTEDLTASIFRVSWTTQKLETPRSPETLVTIYHLHIVLYQNNWTFNGILFPSLNNSWLHYSIWKLFLYTFACLTRLDFSLKSSCLTELFSSSVFVINMSIPRDKLTLYYLRNHILSEISRTCCRITTKIPSRR